MQKAKKKDSSDGCSVFTGTAYEIQFHLASGRPHTLIIDERTHKKPYKSKWCDWNSLLSPVHNALRSSQMLVCVSIYPYSITCWFLPQKTTNALSQCPKYYDAQLNQFCIYLRNSHNNAGIGCSSQILIAHLFTFHFNMFPWFSPILLFHRNKAIFGCFTEFSSPSFFLLKKFTISIASERILELLIRSTTWIRRNLVFHKKKPNI